MNARTLTFSSVSPKRESRKGKQNENEFVFLDLEKRETFYINCSTFPQLEQSCISNVKLAGRLAGWQE